MNSFLPDWARAPSVCHRGRSAFISLRYFKHDSANDNRVDAGEAECTNCEFMDLLDEGEIIDGEFCCRQCLDEWDREWNDSRTP